jgi:hypothetical protein
LTEWKAAVAILRRGQMVVQTKLQFFPDRFFPAEKRVVQFGKRRHLVTVPKLFSQSFRFKVIFVNRLATVLQVAN